MAATPDTVKSRCVIFFGGYENASAEQQYNRLKREISRFERTWNFRSEVGAPREENGGTVLAWPIVTEGPNWRADTRFHYYSWNDLIAEDFSHHDWRAIPTGLAALLDFAVTGTAIRYLIVAWRYWLFSFYPFALSIMFALISIAILSGLSDLGVPMPWFVAIPLGILLFWGLVRWPGDRLRLRYMLNDWAFASGIAWGRRRAYQDRLDQFAEALRRTIRDTDAEEVVIIGHSLGAVLATETLARALASEPDLVRAGPPITLTTVGSSLLKIALHPAARGLRRAIKRVLDATDIAWIDYSALVDPLNFYRCDPNTVLGLKAARGPVIRTAKIRAMLGEDGYKRFKGDFLRLHRQFVMGNGARYHCDFFMACCGPMGQTARLEDMTGATENFAEDGSYRPTMTCPPEQPVFVKPGPDR